MLQLDAPGLIDSWQTRRMREDARALKLLRTYSSGGVSIPYSNKLRLLPLASPSQAHAVNPAEDDTSPPPATHSCAQWRRVPRLCGIRISPAAQQKITERLHRHRLGGPVLRAAALPQLLGTFELAVLVDSTSEDHERKTLMEEIQRTTSALVSFAAKRSWHVSWHTFVRQKAAQ